MCAQGMMTDRVSSQTYTFLHQTTTIAQRSTIFWRYRLAVAYPMINLRAAGFEVSENETMVT